jgi:hypothetical protein
MDCSTWQEHMVWPVTACGQQVLTQPHREHDRCHRLELVGSRVLGHPDSKLHALHHTNTHDRFLSAVPTRKLHLAVAVHDAPVPLSVVLSR